MRIFDWRQAWVIRGYADVGGRWPVERGKRKETGEEGEEDALFEVCVEMLLTGQQRRRGRVVHAVQVDSVKMEDGAVICSGIEWSHAG